MDRKKLFRSWWPWLIILVVVFALFVLPSLASSSQYTSVNTSEAISQIQAGNVSKATVHDKEQTLDLHQMAQPLAEWLRRVRYDPRYANGWRYLNRAHATAKVPGQSMLACSLW